MSALSPVKKPEPAKAAEPAKTEPPKAEAAATASPPPAPAQPSAAEVARQVRRARARALVTAFALWVGLPTLLGAIYYGAVARDQFESASTLVVLGSDESAAQRLVLLREYMLSRDMLQQLEARVGFSEHYQKAGDFVTRLSADAGSERRFDSFLDHVDVQYDSHTHVSRLRVRAYSAQRAQAFAREMLALAKTFVAGVEGAGPTMVTVAEPSAPSDATHPQRVRGVFTVFFVSLALFGIGSLLIAAIREHAHF